MEEACKDNRPIPPGGELSDQDSCTDNEDDELMNEKNESENGKTDVTKVGMDNAFYGDYGIPLNASTQNLILNYYDNEMAKRSYPTMSSMSRIRSLHDKLQLLQQNQSDKKSHIPLELESDSGSSGYSKKVPDAKALMASQIFATTIRVFDEGFDTIVEDNFWKCFESKKPKPWNWNMYLFPLWAIGVVVRYFILFPIRLVIFIVGWILFGLGMLVVQGCMRKGARRTGLEHSLISMMCGVFCITWGAVIRYYGSPYEPRPGEPNPVYVANHTSMIDVIILQQVRCFSLVGQRHKGIVRFLQEQVLGCLQCVWFDRGAIKDRAIVAKTLHEHALDPTRNPLLVFPEGTCVNNDYLIQFKKGIFEIGVPVLPVAMKYNKMFVDPFWNSRMQSFPQHLMELMTSWVLICDVWYLEPMERFPGEKAENFAARVKAAIAKKSGLKNVEWDGYMKYWKPSERYLHSRQESFANKFRNIVQSVRDTHQSEKLEMSVKLEKALDLTFVTPPGDSENTLRKRIVQ